MRHGGLFTLAMALMGGAAAAADYHAPRTVYGQPDLQGVWNTHYGEPLEAPPDMPSLTLPEAEAKAYSRKLAAGITGLPALSQDPEVAEISADPNRSGLPKVNGQWRTRQLVQPADGMLPLTPAARGQVRLIESALRTLTEPPVPTDNPEVRGDAERCLAGWGQPPMANTGDLSPRQILQTKDAVVILAEYGPDLRVIPFTDKHGPAVDNSPLGDSIAHWEGETLVVETVAMPARDTLRPFPTMFVSPKAKVIERFTRTSKTELLYQYTVVDPQFYTGPWLAEYPMERINKPIYEFACHEGNYSLPNILAGARAKEREAAARKLTAAQVSPPKQN
jgi:hypothetical protein